MAAAARRSWALAAVLLLAATPACSTDGSGGDGGITHLSVVGDFGTGGRKERAVAEAIRERAEDVGLDALVTTGDNVYPDGSPENFDQAWNEPYGWVTDEGIEVVASLGNHDVQDGHGDEVQELLGMPGPWYATTVGRVQLVVLDSNDVEDDQQNRFLARTLDAPLRDGTAYRVVVFHEPAYSCGRDPDDDVQEEWLPLIADGDVDLVLTGHNHMYERFSPDDEPMHVVTGGGGATLHEPEGCPAGQPEPDETASVLHFVALEADDDELRLTALTPDGEVLDEATVTRR